MLLQIGPIVIDTKISQLKILAVSSVSDIEQ